MYPAGKDTLPSSVQALLSFSCPPFGFFLLCGWALHQSAYLPLWIAAIMNIVLSQPCGKIFVGDPHQQIYTFRGAVNALFTVPHTHVFYLTQVRLSLLPSPQMCVHTHNTHTSLCGAPHPGFPVLPVCWALCKVLSELTVCSRSTPLSRGSPWFSGVCRVRTVFEIVTCLLRRVDICTDDAEVVVSRGLSSSPPL